MMVSGLEPSVESETDVIDREIGARLRHVRTLRGLTQAELGRVVGVSFQQVQKYESGTNRISSSALILLARALDVPPAELLGEGRASARRIDWTLLSEDGAQALLQTIGQLPPHGRRIVLLLLRALADGAAADAEDQPLATTLSEELAIQPFRERRNC